MTLNNPHLQLSTHHALEVSLWEEVPGFFLGKAGKVGKYQPLMKKLRCVVLFLSDRFFHLVPLGRRNIDESSLSSFYGKWFIERMTHIILTSNQIYLPSDSFAVHIKKPQTLEVTFPTPFYRSRFHSPSQKGHGSIHVSSSPQIALVKFCRG